MRKYIRPVLLEKRNKRVKKNKKTTKENTYKNVTEQAKNIKITIF